MHTDEGAASADGFEYTLTRRALRQIKAEAWDAGYRYACRDHRGYDSCGTGDHGQRHVNPHVDRQGS